MHQDCSAQSKKKSHGCPKQDKAKAQGVKLPLTVSKSNLEQAQGGGNSKETTINGFLQVKVVFSNHVLNQIIMTWQL
jgi:hypothetical protein